MDSKPNPGFIGTASELMVVRGREVEIIMQVKWHELSVVSSVWGVQHGKCGEYRTVHGRVAGSRS